MGELADALDQFEVDMGADGELQFTSTKTPEEKSGEEKPGEEKKAEPTGEEKRLKDTQAALTQSTGEVNELKGTVKDLITAMNQKTADEEAAKIPTAESMVQEGETPIDVLSDSQRGMQFLTSLVREAVASDTKDASDAKESNNTAVRQELQEAIDNNADFKDHIASIHRLVKKQPNLTFQNAYDLVKEAGSEPQESAKATDKKESEEKAAPTDAELEAIQERGKKLQTEESLSSEGLDQKAGPASTVKDAVLESIEELGI